jgi:hypothetical protein
LTTLALVVELATACGGSHPAALPPPGPLPAAGHASPQAATAGFLEGISKGGGAACLYAAPEDLLECGEAFTAAVGFSASDLGIGAATVRGTQAVVSVTGRICIAQTGKQTCAVNASRTSGQPDGRSAKAFAAAYHPSGHESIGKRAIPCEQIGGQWYVDLLGS